MQEFAIFTTVPFDTVAREKKTAAINWMYFVYNAVVGVKRAVVANARRDTCSREVFRHEVSLLIIIINSRFNWDIGIFQWSC